MTCSENVGRHFSQVAKNREAPTTARSKNVARRSPENLRAVTRGDVHGRLFHALKFPLLYTDLRTEPAHGFENDRARPAAGFGLAISWDRNKATTNDEGSLAALTRGFSDRPACKSNKTTTATATTTMTETGRTWPVMIFVTSVRRS